MRKLLVVIAISIFGVLLMPRQTVAQESQAKTLVVADFESFPNNLGGEIGVYGSLEPNWDDKSTPYSWYYGSTTPGYDAKNVHGGKVSFRLVNSLGTKKDKEWGSFSMDLGPVTDATTVPRKIVGKDVMRYKFLTFWVKGEKGGEKMEVLVRDSHARDYLPQAIYKIPEVTTEWKKVSVPLEEIHKMGADLKSVVNIGMAFGPDLGNKEGAIVYIDDFVFEGEAEAETLF